MRRLVCWLTPILLAVALAGFWAVRPPRISASLYDLVGAAAERIPRFVRESSSSEVAVLIASTNAEHARAAARLFATNFTRAGALPAGALDFLRANRAGLVAPEAAQELSTAEGRARIARRALRRLYASPVPPVLGVADDPFALADGFLSGLAPVGATRTADGFPSLVTNGETRLLVRLQLPAAAQRDIEETVSFCDRLRDLSGLPADTRVRLTGAPIHAALSARRCKGEINALTVFSLLFIAGLSLVAFRSIRWIPLLAASLSVSALAGGLALVALFRDIHVMTLVMGTTVLGLVIDYSFHGLLSSAEDRSALRRNLLVSFLTTEISLVPLMLATIPVLRQSAVFLGVGLAAALGYVLSGYPTRTLPSAPHVRAPGFAFHAGWRWAMIAGLALAGTGIARVTVRTEVSALYRPPAELAEAERQRAAFGTIDFSRIPALSERRKIAANVEKLYAEHGPALAQTLGRTTLEPPPAPTEILTRPQALLDSIFSTWTGETLGRLGGSILVLLAVVLLLCGRRAFGILLPPLAALAAVAGLLGWANVPLNLFHLLAAFLLLGMGIDYAVFLQSSGRAAFKPAFCSLLTSVAGFGALVFVSLPVISSFGIVLGLGLPIAFFLALTYKGSDPLYVKTGSVPTERGANLLGMEILLLFYRIFGLRVLHLGSAGVGLCVWLFSANVRRASPSLRKVVNFTHSLADKLVVMAEGRHLPAVVTEKSPDAEAFLADVKSGRGVFILSSHVGTIEVLTALGACAHTFHAWMDFDRTGVFNRFYLRHAKRRRVVIHPISEFGPETVFEAGEWIDGGDCLVMAGDRGDGAFHFAAAFDHPVYFVACLAETGRRYRAVIRRLPDGRKEMNAAYAAILAELVRSHPEQHFNWNA